MIHYHGSPITPEHVAAVIYKGRHAMVSFCDPTQIETVASVCQSFCLDNGAFSAWKRGEKPDWDAYYKWVERWMRHPGFDFAIIPDSVEGGTRENDNLIYYWPFGESIGVPVWHLHEPLTRLQGLAESWPRIALGSSGEYKTPLSPAWERRMSEAMEAICDESGRPKVKLHGLRMLDLNVFTRFPLSSADSTNVARNIGIDSRWRGTYLPANKAARGVVIAERIESQQSPAMWNRNLQVRLWNAEADDTDGQMVLGSEGGLGGAASILDSMGTNTEVAGEAF